MLVLNEIYDWREVSVFTYEQVKRGWVEDLKRAV